MRKFTLDNRGVRCHPSVTLGYAKWIAKRGDIIVFKEHYEDGSGESLMGRSLGRLASVEKDGLEDCKGWLCLVVPNLTFTHCMIRWVCPNDVVEIRSCPSNTPATFFSLEMCDEKDDIWAQTNEEATRVALAIEKGGWAEPISSMERGYTGRAK